VDHLHGALFTTLSNVALNARDPLSKTAIPAGKQRYGIELSGPIVAHRAGSIAANAINETRIGYTWKRAQQTPNSTAPSLQVAGFFTSGGSTSQALNDRERYLEIDDDVLFSRGQHSIKFGAQSLALFQHNLVPSTFNGAYIFGGGDAPALDAAQNPAGHHTSITAAEQYRRAQLSSRRSSD
jgi:hypothetical protein